MKNAIVITGASSGFGALTARAQARAGHTVYASMRETTGRNAPQVREVEKYAAERGADLRAIEPDVLKQEFVDVVMYLHGGGCILGSKNTNDRLIREIANGANVTLVFVNYTPSPEAKYPVPIEQTYAATKYIAENVALPEPQRSEDDL